ncbi:co-chaperone HscB [Idiomarina tyrosinivorans]|nr:co-chaperone HscB [Idiomarina tyrosinivorans]
MMNHFALFDLPVSPNLDLDELQSRYRRLQQALHPDRFANAGERDKLLAMQKTSQLNDAYQTLKQPLSRAEYLLQLQGVDLQHEQQTIKDTEFLMAQMEWRERLETLSSADDPWQAISAAHNDLKQETQALQQAVDSALEDTSQADLEAVAEDIRKLKFLHKLAREIDAIEEQLLDDV